MDAVDQVAAGARAMLQQLRRLEMTWSLRPGTVVHGERTQTMQVMLDGDIAMTRVASLIGTLPAGARVQVMSVPPSGMYVVGWHGPTDGMYAPELTASTDPSLGSGGNFTQEGMWTLRNGILHVWIRLRFGTSGASAGSGNYRVELPAAINTDVMTASTTIAAGTTVGGGTIRDNSAVTAGSRMISAQLATAAGGPNGGATLMLNVLDGTATQITATSPFTWAASDAISLEVAYVPAAIPHVR